MGQRINSLCDLPLTTARRRLGALAFGSRQIAAYDGADVDFLQLVANQVASGLALTLSGLGLSSLIGDAFVGIPGRGVPKLHIPVLSDLPFVGRILFGQDVLTYFAWALAIAVWYFLFRTRGGLIIRAVGDNHVSAHALGGQLARQGERLRDGRLRNVESSVEACDLRQRRHRIMHRTDDGNGLW